jgi:hypothetical protein
VSDIVWETLRVIVAGVGAVGAWFIVGPLARVVVRVAFQRRMSDGGVTLKAGGDKGGRNADVPKDVLPIEILEGARKEGRFYLVQGKEMNLDEVDQFLEKNKGMWKKVYIVRSLDAPAEIEGADRPAGRLKELIVPKHNLLWELKRR